MKHAGPAALDELRDMIASLRALGCQERRPAAPGCQERRPGVFYRNGRAWLHFHEDEAGLFADIRMSSDRQRFPVSTVDQRATVLALVARSS